MLLRTRRAVALAAALFLLAVPFALSVGGSWTIVGWNNLGMHCMDADYSIFAILPPYNTIHAQIVDPNGHLVASASGLEVTYEAVADPNGSENRSSIGKTNFWQHVQDIFGASPPEDRSELLGRAARRSARRRAIPGGRSPSRARCRRPAASASRRWRGRSPSRDRTARGRRTRRRAARRGRAGRNSPR